MDKILEFFTDAGDTIKEFMIRYQSNPFFWLLLFFLGLGIFKLGYEYLSKDK